MVLTLNDKKYNVNAMSEKSYNIDGEDFIGLSFNITDYGMSMEEATEMLNKIDTVKVVRTNESGEETTIDFSKYNKVYKIDRRITDNLDSIQVILRAE